MVHALLVSRAPPYLSRQFSCLIMFASIYEPFHRAILLVVSMGLAFAPLMVYAVKPPPSPKSLLVKEAHERYQQQKMGLFVHYVPTLTVDPQTNQPVQDIDELAKKFDAVQFAKDAADFGVEYVIFTAHHFSARMLYPSAVSKRWRDDRRKADSSEERNWKTYSDVDVIDRLATELAKKKIDLNLYVHPVDGHDFSKEDQENTGWFECDSGHAKWNDFQNQLFDELCKRYGTRIRGLWFDGMYAHHGKNGWHGCIDQPRFRETLLRYNPQLILTANVAGVRDKNPAADWVAADYRAWECYSVTEKSLGMLGVNPNADPSNSFTWPGTKEQVAWVVTNSWWASHKSNQIRYPAEELYRYLVLQASLSDSGGLAISVGCFPGTLADQPNGSIWEGNVRERLVELNQLIKPVAESIKNTKASEAYVTADHQWLEQKDWGVATDAPDGTVTYLHVLRPPSGRDLRIGPPANGTPFRAASILPSMTSVILKGDASNGYTVSLPEGVSWSPLDTVIKLEVDGDAIRRTLVTERDQLKAKVLSNPRHPSIGMARKAIKDVSTLKKTSTFHELRSGVDQLQQALARLDEMPPPPAASNLAQSKSVEASSSHPSTLASVLTSGDRSGSAFWSSGDEQAKENHEVSVTIDMEAEKRIGEVWLYPRQQGSPDGFPVDFAIMASSDGKSWKILRQVKDQTTPSSGHPRRYEFAPTQTRYLRIHATKLRAMKDDYHLYRMQLSRMEIFPPNP